MTGEDWANAALQALAEGGPAAVAVEPVAQRLGATKGSFYWHFANRQALLEAALRAWEDGTERIIEMLLRIPDPVARMRTLLEGAFGDPSDAAISFRLISAADDPIVAEVARRVSCRRLTVMQAALEEAGQAPEEARARVVAGYSSYLGIAALLRIGAIEAVPPDIADQAMHEMGL
ncbi:TetR/AcrR family transcriptional regulator [Nonomuraea sp. NBC_01738]|uniref:TetR/AcrR family transcriptional regulator n=1 Tax=Nonomuraea sp. NBC_01738 TaxID=2976003 RepID=UPI002E142CEE|nr:TetR/AcrR family transcriptional regulator [Nonomuraea sp. NBC_01738]